MPLIYTYPTVSPTLQDLVLLTDTSDNSKTTKTATISSILDIGATVVTLIVEGTDDTTIAVASYGVNFV